MLAYEHKLNQQVLAAPYIEGLSAEPASAVYKPRPMSEARGFTARIGNPIKFVRAIETAALKL